MYVCIYVVTSRDQSSPSVMWVVGIQLRSPGLVQSSFTWWTIFPAQEDVLISSNKSLKKNLVVQNDNSWGDSFLLTLALKRVLEGELGF